MYPRTIPWRCRRLRIERLDSRALLMAAPIGAEFSVRMSDGDALSTTESVAVDYVGNSLVTWEHESGIQFARFDRLGNRTQTATVSPVGFHASAAMDADGDFVIIYVAPSGRETEPRLDILGQRFDSTGRPVGDQLTIGPISSHNFLSAPSVAMNASGAFAVAWQREHDGQDAVFARFYDRFGAVQGPEVRVDNDFVATRPSVALNDAGRATIAWTGLQNIRLRQFNANGAAVSDPILVAAEDGSRAPDVAVNGAGEIVVVWSFSEPEEFHEEIRARLFSSYAEPRGPEFSIAKDQFTQISDLFGSPVVAMEEDGEFTVSWFDTIAQDYEGSFDFYNVRAQSFSRDGTPLAIPLQINLPVGEDQQYPSIAMTPTGDGILGWQNVTLGGGFDLKLKRLASRDRADLHSLSFAGDAYLAGVPVDDSDIVLLTATDEEHGFSAFFDGSDVGLAAASEDIDAFCFLPDGDLLVSTVGAFSVRQLYVDPENGRGESIAGSGEDILRFTPYAFGSNTGGLWSLFLDGSTVGLSGKDENIDAIGALTDGSILISTAGHLAVAGVQAMDEDLVRLDRATQRFSMYFDGSDVGLSSESEDIDAVFVQRHPIAGDTLHISTRGSFAAPGIHGDNEDIFSFKPTRLGGTTSGSYQTTLALDGSRYGLAAFDVDGYLVEPRRNQASGSVTASVSPAPRETSTAAQAVGEPSQATRVTPPRLSAYQSSATAAGMDVAVNAEALKRWPRRIPRELLD